MLILIALAIAILGALYCHYRSNYFGVMFNCILIGINIGSLLHILLK